MEKNGSFSGRATTGTIAGHEYVDLGLSVKWATCNVGASCPEDYGDYYAWGEISTKPSYNKDNCETWGKRISDIKGTYRDVAHAKWGGSWRLPTDAEFEELLDSENCTWEWTTQKGVTGYKVTSRKNGNSIFLPAAGWRNGTSLDGAAQLGYYWSSTPRRSYARDAYFLDSDSSYYNTGWGDRYSGLTVRPVSSSDYDADYLRTHTVAGHEYVDLGLSVMWATCNVGASRLEEYGDYYAWGETSVKSSYDEDNCETWEKDIGDIGGTSRDVARVKWGSPWRMPTDAEFEELLNKDNCTWKRTTQKGVTGYKVTSRKNGNAIFLPAAGWRDGTLNDTAGQDGDYWSSTPRWINTQDACDLYFHFYGGNHVTARTERYFGFTVRPVMPLGDDVETHRRLLAGNDDNVSQPLGTPAASQQSAKVKGTIAGHDYVDMGLSVMWATCNVGASSPEDYGDYYAWGETETKSLFREGNCETWEKEIGDIKGTSRDVAHVKWGSPWRMPTRAEYEELLDSDNCTWTWITQGGHNGYKVTSKKNGNSIFLPAAGCRYGTSLDAADPWGLYWSSTPDGGDARYAYYLDFYGGGVYGTVWGDRDSGHTIRPVMSLGDDAETHRRLFADNDDNASPPLGTPASSRQVAKDKEAIAGHDYVDMGLSVKWATCNVGAISPEGYGNYYAWGETKTKRLYDEDNCETWKKEIGDIGGTSRDVARVKRGSPWRLPTRAEFEELLDPENCTWEWTTQKGVTGYKVTSRKNGNSIFLPAAGVRNETSLGDAGKYGHYWSSTPYWGGAQIAYSLYFGWSDHGTCPNYRDYWRTIRPVAESVRAAKGTINGHAYVDLGLSVKWATCNVGADSPGAYGNYYAWGETKTKSSYGEDNCETYGKDIGDIKGTSRDVARVKWGGSWRMPTKAEFEELLNTANCTWTWITEGGHRGYKVTSKKNGNSIFLPAASYRYGTPASIGSYYYGMSLHDAGQHGDYWSSTPHGSDPQGAYKLSFGSSNRYTFWECRNGGLTIRPVTE